MEKLKKKNKYSQYTIFYKNDKEILKIEGEPLDALAFVDDKKIDWDILKTFDFNSNNFIVIDKELERGNNSKELDQDKKHQRNV